MAKKAIQPWKKEETFSLSRDRKPVLMAFLVAFTLFSLLYAGVSVSRSSFMDMAMNQYLLNKAAPASAQRLILAAAVPKHARVAASRELLFLFVSLLTSWTSSTAAYYFLESRDDAELAPRAQEFYKFFLTLRSCVALVLAYGFLLEIAALLLLQNSGASSAFLAAAVLLASIIRILSFSVGTGLGQALAMSAIDDEGPAGIDALRRPFRLLLRRSPPSDLELPV